MAPIDRPAGMAGTGHPRGPFVPIHCPAESAAAIVATPGPDRPLLSPIRPGGSTHLGPGSGPHFGSETLD